MRYETPKVKSVKIDDVLQQLGPARALLYAPGGGQPGSSGGTSSGGSSGGTSGGSSGASSG
jgi:hypothetical protein